MEISTDPPMGAVFVSGLAHPQVPVLGGHLSASAG